MGEVPGYFHPALGVLMLPTIYQKDCTIALFPNISPGEEIDILVQMKDAPKRFITVIAKEVKFGESDSQGFCELELHYTDPKTNKADKINANRVCMVIKASERKYVGPHFKVGDLITAIDRSYPRSIYQYAGPNEYDARLIDMHFVSLTGYVAKPEEIQREGYRPFVGKRWEYRLATDREIYESKKGLWEGKRFKPDHGPKPSLLQKIKRRLSKKGRTYAKEPKSS